MRPGSMHTLRFYGSGLHAPVDWSGFRRVLGCIHVFNVVLVKTMRLAVIASGMGGGKRVACRKLM